MFSMNFVMIWPDFINIDRVVQKISDPEVVKNWPTNRKDKKSVLYMCTGNGLSFRKRNSEIDEVIHIPVSVLTK